MKDLYYLFLLGKFLANVLPLKWAYALACFISDIKFFCKAEDRKILEKNLAVVLEGQDADIPGIAREVLRNFSRYLADFFRSRKIDEAFIKEKVEFVNEHYLEEVKKLHKGYIALAAHLGNWELGGQIFSSQGNPLFGVILPHKSKRLTDLFNRQRLLGGMKAVSVGSGRKIMRFLKENKVVALVGDRDFSHTEVEVEFFGRKAYLPLGPGFFASKLKCPLLPVFCIRKNIYNYQMLYEKPIYPGDKSKEEIVQEAAKVLEKVIGQYPEQWYSFGKIWETE